MSGSAQYAASSSAARRWLGRAVLVILALGIVGLLTAYFLAGRPVPMRLVAVLDDYEYTLRACPRGVLTWTDARTITFYDWRGRPRWLVPLPAVDDRGWPDDGYCLRAINLGWRTWSLAPDGRVLVIIAAAGSGVRVQAWRDGQPLWQAAVPVDPRRLRLHASANGDYHSMRDCVEVSATDTGGAWLAILERDACRVMRLEEGKVVAHGRLPYPRGTVAKQQVHCLLPAGGTAVYLHAYEEWLYAMREQDGTLRFTAPTRVGSPIWLAADGTLGYPYESGMETPAGGYAPKALAMPPGWQREQWLDDLGDFPIPPVQPARGADLVLSSTGRWFASMYRKGVGVRVADGGQRVLTISANRERTHLALRGDWPFVRLVNDPDGRYRLTMLAFPGRPLAQLNVPMDHRLITVDGTDYDLQDAAFVSPDGRAALIGVMKGDNTRYLLFRW